MMRSLRSRPNASCRSLTNCGNAHRVALQLEVALQVAAGAERAAAAGHEDDPDGVVRAACETAASNAPIISQLIAFSSAGRFSVMVAASPSASGIGGGRVLDDQFAPLRAP